MLNKFISIVASSVVLGVMGASVASADVLDDIKKKAC